MTTTIVFYYKPITGETAKVDDVAGIQIEARDQGATIFMPNSATQRLFDHMWHSGMRPSHVGQVQNRSAAGSGRQSGGVSRSPIVRQIQRKKKDQE